MLTTIRAFILAVVLAGSASPALAQELSVGTWTGTIRAMSGPMRNANTRPVSIVVKKIPDPHWRWRTSGDLLVATFIVPGNSYELSGLVLKNDKLSYSFASPTNDEPVRCVLSRQPEGGFEGDCAGGDFNRRITLNPPADSK